MLIGGTDNDILIGRKCSDQFAGETVEVRVFWNNGDGSDKMEGGIRNEITARTE